MKENDNIAAIPTSSAPQGAATPSRAEWFPMRVTYGRGQQVKAFLDRLSVENFLPMRRMAVISGDAVAMREEPAVSNLIFLHATRETITALKRGGSQAEPLRYMTRRPLSSPGENVIITVPDRQMDNFIRACQGPAGAADFLAPDELRGKTQHRVEIVSGPFRGVEGVVKRVHGSRSVVVELDGLCAVRLRMVGKAEMRVMEE